MQRAAQRALRRCGAQGSSMKVVAGVYYECGDYYDLAVVVDDDDDDGVDGDYHRWDKRKKKKVAVVVVVVMVVVIEKQLPPPLQSQSRPSSLD